MTLDAWLAIAHHLAVFGILVVLVVESTLVRPGIDAGAIRRVGRVDSAYGVLAATVLAVGASRVVWGAKGSDFYLENPVFWTKMIVFGAIGLLSIWPTIRFIRWRREQTAPPDEEVARARRFVQVQLALFFALPVLAAVMARGIGQ